MISETAKAIVEGFKSEGLNPSFEDVIRLNALGLEVDRGEVIADLAAVPRRAFLGDLVLTEPSVAVRMWLDEATARLPESVQPSHLTAFALWENASAPPPCTDARAVADAVLSFELDHLAQFADSEILSAVLWCLSGADPESEEVPDVPNETRNTARSFRFAPADIASRAREKFLKAVSIGIPESVAIKQTVPILETLIVLDTLKRGGFDPKSERAQALGRLYYTADNIKTRLLEDKNGGN